MVQTVGSWLRVTSVAASCYASNIIQVTSYEITFLCVKLFRYNDENFITRMKKWSVLGSKGVKGGRSCRLRRCGGALYFINGRAYWPLRCEDQEAWTGLGWTESHPAVMPRGHAAKSFIKLSIHWKHFFFFFTVHNTIFIPRHQCQGPERTWCF